MVNIDEIFFYLKSQYLTHNEEQRTFIQNIPSQENMPSFDYWLLINWLPITDYLKTFSKSLKEDENMSLKNKVLHGGWISIASKVYRRENNLSGRFVD